MDGRSRPEARHDLWCHGRRRLSRAVDRPVHWHDFHATVLHLLGIDHERLTYYHNGIRRRLTNVHGQVIGPVLG